MEKISKTKPFSRETRNTRLWIGLLVPPSAWAVQLQTVYLLSEYACRTGSFSWINVVSIVAILLAIGAGFVSLRAWRKAGGQWKSEEAGTLSRSRFMAVLGLLLSGLFAVVIFAQWLPALFRVPCDK